MMLAQPSTFVTDFGHYLENDQGDILIAGTRIVLWQIARAYEAGNSPEQIALDFPALSLTQIYAAITYFLANRQILLVDMGMSDISDTQENLVKRLRVRLSNRYQIINEDNRVQLVAHEATLSSG